MAKSDERTDPGRFLPDPDQLAAIVAANIRAHAIRAEATARKAGVKIIKRRSDDEANQDESSR